jgi:hypothetical protein
MKKKSRKIRKKDLPNPTKAYTGRSTTKKSFRPHAQKYNDKEYDDNGHTQESPYLRVASSKNYDKGNIIALGLSDTKET